jgi:hypothetical protein
MTTAGKIHLYTFWNPNVYPDTIEEHVQTWARELAVKWIILYDDQTWLVENGKSLNLRALLPGNMIFKGILGNKEVRRINDQAKKGETLLFIQCLNIFHKPLYVGKVKQVEIIGKSGMERSDSLIPAYYHDVIAERNLRPHCAITLTDMMEVKLLELCNLIPVAEFQSDKFPFPYPMLVTQREPKLLFENVIPQKFDKLEIIHEHEPVSRKTCWYVKQPKSLDSKKPLTLGKKEVDILRYFEGDESQIIKAVSIAKKIKKDSQYVQNLVSRINKKFKMHYNRNLIKHGGGKCNLLANKIIISQ